MLLLKKRRPVSLLMRPDLTRLTVDNEAAVFISGSCSDTPFVIEKPNDVIPCTELIFDPDKSLLSAVFPLSVEGSTARFAVNYDPSDIAVFDAEGTSEIETDLLNSNFRMIASAMISGGMAKFDFSLNVSCLVAVYTV